MNYRQGYLRRGTRLSLERCLFVTEDLFGLLYTTYQCVPKCNTSYRKWQTKVAGQVAMPRVHHNQRKGSRLNWVSRYFLRRQSCSVVQWSLTWLIRGVSRCYRKIFKIMSYSTRVQILLFSISLCTIFTRNISLVLHVLYMRHLL